MTKKAAASTNRFQKGASENERLCVSLIQRYSIQDGPGIRTTVFLKGCSLRCSWCQNPELINAHVEIMSRDAKCISCGTCVKVCPMGAICFSESGRRKIDKKKCNVCLRCVEVCPTKALVKIGEYMTIEEIIKEIERDEVFYARSGGGITISGGEPLFHGAATIQLLRACKEKGLHTALDTSGYTPLGILKSALQYVDLLLFDIKHMNSRLHKAGTGQGNELILENLYACCDLCRVWLRVPLIPSYNDSMENYDSIGDLGRRIRPERVSILPFNKLGWEKWTNLGKEYVFAELDAPSVECIEIARKRIGSFGLEVLVGE